MALQLGKWSEKRWPETCSLSPLTCLQENGNKFRAFSHYFSEEGIPKLLHGGILQNAFWYKTQVPMPGEPIFLEESVFLKTMSNSFSQIHGICSHQCQESSSATDSVKKPSGTRTST